MVFEIAARAAAGRIGRLRTPHGDVATPTLLPVVNPNIDLVSPQEMQRLFGCEMVITNAYVLWKHEALRRAATESGVHDVIGWAGPVMTDSGTFQMYVYGDVDVPAADIVRFQAAAGVDVGTCLDVFVTPEMDAATAQDAVRTTVARTEEAAAVWKDAAPAGALLNATVQGGVHLDLRKSCAAAYRDLGVGYHTIGGVVPLMQEQRYAELVDAILWSQQGLRADRPVHLFGAGHPLVFPLATALGCDLFDSSSYAKYAKDGRAMTPEATVHVADFADEPDWPFETRHLATWTPREMAQALSAPRRGRPDPGRPGVGPDAGPDGAPSAASHATDDPVRALALHNLDVCFTDIRRIRRAIRDGVLWELVERRAASHPLLAAATRRLGRPEYQAWLETREPESASRALRYTGSLTHRRPVFARIRHRLAARFTPLGAPVPAAMEPPYAAEGEEKREIAFHKEPRSKPYAAAIGWALDGEQDHAVISALGPVPLGLDEAYPFAQSVLPRLEDLDREHMGWVGDAKDALLHAHDLMPAIPGPPGSAGRADADFMQVLRTADWQFGAGAGLALTGALPAGDVRARLEAGRGGMEEAGTVAPLVAADEAGRLAAATGLRCDRSKATGKLRTVHLDGEHVLSLRAGDGLFTLKAAGARLLHAALPPPAQRVVVAADSVPWNRAGKSVFAHFVASMDEALRPGAECLVVDGADALVAVGQVLLNAAEAADFQAGMAVKVRQGIAA